MEKVVREWAKTASGGIRLGSMNKGIRIKCLAFADDMAMLAEAWEQAKEQSLELLKQAEKIGLKIAFGKTKIIINIKNPPKYLRVGEQKIEIVRDLKYLGEWISWNGLEKKAMESRRNKMETAF